MSLALLLGTELSVDVEASHEVFGINAPGPYVERVAALGITYVPVRSLTRSWAPASDLAAFRELVHTILSLDLDVHDVRRVRGRMFVQGRGPRRARKHEQSMEATSALRPRDRVHQRPWPSPDPDR